jgi:hypothetical protein
VRLQIFAERAAQRRNRCAIERRFARNTADPVRAE